MEPGSDPAQIDREHNEELRKARQRRLGKVIVIAGLLILLAIFIIQNSDRVRIDYVFFDRDTRLIWIMLACSVVGFIIGYLVGRPGKVRFHNRED